MTVREGPLTTQELYEQLREQALRERGHPTVWHEADIDGHHLYMADTSFGDGPIFRCDGHGWQIAYNDAPITRDTTSEHLAEALALADRAIWKSRFETIQGKDEAMRLLGFALFNHAKGNREATETLMRKAYKALAGKEWDG